MKIATWNVNSIRARIKNFIDWVGEEKPDVILLQELKCTNEQFPFLEFENLNYNIEVNGQKARNGVAIFSKFPMSNVIKELPLYGIETKDEDSRYLEVIINYKNKALKIASIYLPNGGPSVIDVNNGVKDLTSTSNFNFKMRFNDRLTQKFKESIKNDEIAIFGGDYNVCPNLYMDVYSTNKDGDITCTEKERQKFKEFLNIGMTDIWRKLNPDLKEYTWWGYRPHYMREKNLGFRLDALMTTPNASKLIEKCEIFPDVRTQEKPSDHVPMMCVVE